MKATDILTEIKVALFPAQYAGMTFSHLFAVVERVEKTVTYAELEFALRLLIETGEVDSQGISDLKQMAVFRLTENGNS